MTLKEAMQYRGMTSAKFAKMVSVRHTTVKGWLENGLSGVTAQRLQTIARLLDGGVLITEDGVEIELYGGKG